MQDPNAGYTYDEAALVGCELEKLGVELDWDWIDNHTVHAGCD